MNRKYIPAIAILILICATTASAFAAKARFSKVSFTLGSLIASGDLAGLGRDDVTVTLEASGVPVVSCANPNGSKAPGQNPPKVSARGDQFLAHQTYTKNGSSPFFVETGAVEIKSAKAMGCPNNNWTATIDFVFWTNATLTLHDVTANKDIVVQKYACTTTRSPDSVSCTLIN